MKKDNILDKDEALKQVIESQLDEYLQWRLESARNLIDMTLLSLRLGQKNLIPTGLEDLYDRFQDMLDDYCVES